MAAGLHTPAAKHLTAAAPPACCIDRPDELSTLSAQVGVEGISLLLQWQPERASDEQRAAQGAAADNYGSALNNPTLYRNFPL